MKVMAAIEYEEVAGVKARDDLGRISVMLQSYLEFD